MLRTAILILSLCPALFAASGKFVITKDIRNALSQISADSLRGHVSFLASDVLEGRCTPSRGGDLAAEYIAAQFRRAGLQPAGDDGYFQTANWRLFEQPMDGFEMKIEKGKQSFPIGKDQVWLYPYTALDLSALPVVKLNLTQEVKSDEVKGKVVAVVFSADASEGHEQYLQLTRLGKALEAAKPALILILAPDCQSEISTRLEDPNDPPGIAPPIHICNPQVIKLLNESESGPTNLALSLHLPAPSVKQVKLRNVIGLLPGSDPVLKETYVLATAHYDHIGIESEGDLKRIYHGADDDASGTASVIELASALMRLKQKPRRSMGFMAFFGEEMGLIGSRYYVRHPAFPVAKTIADINLEVLGRTDTSKGKEIGKLWFTGFDYSEMPSIFQSAGRQTGIEVYKHELYSDQFFVASDNATLASMGVPAHSASVTADLEDVHGVGDIWPKLDYENMVKVDRAIALGLLMIANKPEPPKWNEANPKAEPYFKAWKEHPIAPKLSDYWPWVPGSCK
jgi:hypothetical protein